ncbi:MAG TPA: DnaJ domain-containing protein, partial [Cyclobacteriaceae bacterium]|nr:DnaJ domain-containing protein [Cyclobacteriaceae bacterium]
MKDYYQILRVSHQANAVEIKRAYRRLAVVFHPDKNPSEEASALFQEINEAHEVLADPDKRAMY